MRVPADGVVVEASGHAGGAIREEHVGGASSRTLCLGDAVTPILCKSLSTEAASLTYLALNTGGCL